MVVAVAVVVVVSILQAEDGWSELRTKGLPSQRMS